MKSFSSYLAELHIRLEYHDTLNPKLWTDGKLDPKVRQKLLQFGEAWRQYANIPADAVKDVIMIGGNCNYNYTSVSDIDVHLIVDKAKMGKGNPLLDDYLQDKKVMWTMTHDIKVYGYPLEPYAQDSEASYPANQGVFSLEHNEWINKPEHLGKDFAKDRHIIKKVKFYMNMIDHMIDNKVHTDHTAKLRRKLREMRGAGIQKAGEFSFENLVFKELRNHGYLDKMNDYERKEQDKKLSLEENRTNALELDERFVNLIHDDPRKDQHAHEVMGLLRRSYASIGGIHGSGFKDEEDMKRNIPFWKLNKKNGKVVSAVMYKDKGGRKAVAAATDGSEEGKSGAAEMMKQDLVQGRSYGEKSSKSLSFIKRHVGATELQKHVVPFHQVRHHMDDGEEIRRPPHDDEELQRHPDLKDHFYQRRIGGEWHTKIMLGKPGNPIVRNR